MATPAKGRQGNKEKSSGQQLELNSGGATQSNSAIKEASTIKEDVELLLAFASTPSPQMNPSNAKVLTTASKQKVEQSNQDEILRTSPQQVQGHSTSPATDYAPRIKTLAKLKVRIPRKLKKNRPRASIGSPFKQLNAGGDPALKSSLGSGRRGTISIPCERHKMPTSAFALQTNAQERANASENTVRPSHRQTRKIGLKLQLPGNCKDKIRKDRLPKNKPSAQSRIGEMIIAAAAVETQNNKVVVNNPVSQETGREDNGSPWDRDILALGTTRSLQRFRSSTSAEEKGSPRFIAPQNKRKRCLDYQTSLSEQLNHTIQENYVSAGNQETTGKMRKPCSKRARFADPVVSSYLPADAFGRQSSNEMPVTLQNKLNKNVPRPMSLASNCSAPAHPAPLSPITVSEEPALRLCLKNLFALFWDALFPILERYGWSYAYATPASFECFAVPGTTASERPTALLRSIFEVIQFIKSNGISGKRIPSPSSSLSEPGNISGKGIEKENDEKSASELVNILLKQRRLIAAMRYKLLKQEMEQQQQRILFQQRIILQAQEKKSNSDSACFHKSDKKEVLELRPASVGLPVPIFKGMFTKCKDKAPKTQPNLGKLKNAKRGCKIKMPAEKSSSQKKKAFYVLLTKFP